MLLVVVHDEVRVWWKVVKSGKALEDRFQKKAGPLVVAPSCTVVVVDPDDLGPFLSDMSGDGQVK